MSTDKTTTTSKGHLIVTGATGFIGQQLCPQLVRAGYRLVVIARDPAKAQSLLGDETRVVSDIEMLPDIPYEGLINLAGEPLAGGRWSSVRKARMLESRVGLTRHLVSHFRAKGIAPRTVISASAIGYYGDAGDKLLDESAPAGSGFGAQMCRDWELAAHGFVDMGSRLCLLRIGVVLDQGGGALAAMLPAFRFGLGGPLGAGHQWMSWIHRADLVRLIVHCLETHSLSGAVNGVAPEPLTNRAFAHALGKALHRPAIFPMPAPLLRLVIGEMADEVLLASQRVVPKAATASGFRFLYPELHEALAQIFPQ